MQRSVWVVLDDQHVAARRPLEEPAALLEPDQQAGRILKIRDDVQKRDAPAGGAFAHRDAVQILEVDAGVILPHADERRLGVAERGDGARISRQLDEHNGSRIDEHARGQIERLLRARRHDHVIRDRANPARAEDLRQRLDERAIAAGRAVLQHRGVRPVEHRLRDVTEFVPGEHLRRRKSRGERDQVRDAAAERTHLADRRLPHARRGA